MQPSVSSIPGHTMVEKQDGSAKLQTGDPASPLGVRASRLLCRQLLFFFTSKQS